jgi:hypothetical protein
MRKQKEFDLAISKNGDLVSGSIFISNILPSNVDQSVMTFIPALNKSHASCVKVPSENFSIEIYKDSYTLENLYVQVLFDTVNTNAIIESKNCTDLTSNSKLLYVSNKTFLLEENYNDLTFGINLAFWMCK